MKKLSVILLLFAISAVAMFSVTSCGKEDEPNKMSFSQTKVKATFGDAKSTNGDIIISQTPSEYQIGLYSATLIGTDGTSSYPLFNENDLSNSQIFNFTNGSINIDMSGGTTIPDGSYVSFELGIYFLQMRLQIATTNRGIEWRNMRIYFRDHGEIKRGDVVQVDGQGNIQGWLFGEGQLPDFDPVKPRINAYTHNGDGISWYMFADKLSQTFGPFGNMSFWNSVPNPYNKHVAFSFQESEGQTLIIDFNVTNCWVFGDFNGDGYFGGHDLNPINPSPWQMNLPIITLRLEN